MNEPMIDPHLNVPIDDAYRYETASLLERLGHPLLAFTVAFGNPKFSGSPLKLREYRRYLLGLKVGARWSHVAAAHRLEMIARSIERGLL